MTIQAKYDETISAGKAGHIVNTEVTNCISRTVDTEDGIEFGIAVTQGTEDRSCRETKAGDTKILGITVRDQSVDPAAPNKYRQYDTAAVMTKGVIFVKAGVDVKAGDDVHIVVATGEFKKTGGVEIIGARYDTTATKDTLVAVRLA